jgi:hypothetical protein
MNRIFLIKGKNFEVKPKLYTALGCTWPTSHIHLAGEERIIAIRDCVQELVGHFIDVYLSANPKR